MAQKPTEMFGIEFPLFAFSHCRDVVVAVSKAGGIGVFGALHYTPEQLREELRWIESHVDGRPYGVDLVMPEKFVRDEGRRELSAGELWAMVPEGHVRFAGELAGFDESKPLLIAEGGRLRADSVRAGLAVVPASAGTIAVHDGARPLFSRHVLEDCVAALSEADGAVPGVEVSDTLKRADGERRVTTTVDRRHLWAAQTPQVFRAASLREAYARADSEGATDDATLLERAGFSVTVVPSTPANVKITTPADLPLAGALLAWELESDV